MATALAGVALVLAGCGPAAVQLEPAPQASDPVCAQILMTLPETLGDAERRSTTTQASRAWGSPPITLRCGVEPPGPTTERCLTVESDSGPTVDWIMSELGEQGESSSWKFTTFGRVPAVEVVVPVEYAGDSPTSVLGPLARALEIVPATRECL